MIRRSLIGLGAVALAVPVIAGPLGAAGASSSSVRLAGSVASLPAGAISRGAVPRDERVRVQVQLRLRDQAGADALAKAVSTPGSASYHRYLTAEQFRAQFSPTAAAVAKVSAWLTAQGLTVTGVPDNRFSVSAEGSAAQVEAAFGTSLATVEVNGKTRRVNTSEPSIPADLVASVEGVTGLTQVFVHPTHVGAGDEIPTTAAAEAVGRDGGGRFGRTGCAPVARLPRCPAVLGLLERAAGHRSAEVRQRVPEPPPVGDLRLEARAAPPGLWHLGFSGRGHRRLRRDGGDRRRIRLPDDLR